MPHLVGPSAWLQDFKTAAQRSVNLYPMLVESPNEDSQMVLESAPGLSLVHDFGATVYGLHAVDDRLFAVAGTTLYEVSTADTVVSRGTVAGGSTVSMADGVGQLAIVNGPQLSVFSLSTATITNVTAAGWLGSDVVDFLDGYMIFSEPGEDLFYISAIDDATTLDTLDFSSADTQPDDIVSLIVNRRELYLFGTKSTEVWINSGDPDFPLARYQGTPIDVGIVGARAVCRAAGSLFWIGKTTTGGPYCYTLEGYQPRRASTQTVEQQLLKSTDIASTRVWSYQDAGGEFVCVNAPGLETTWVYDLSTKLWHERGELSGGDWAPSRIVHAASRNGTHYVAGGTKLYKMSRDYHSLAGDALVRERTFPHLVGPSFDSVPYRSLELRCTTGEETAPGAITLESSNDGGRTWFSPLQRSLGNTGARTQRVRWLGLGTCPAGGSRVFRLRSSSAVPLTLQGVVIE
jgi:hypothetical protein